MKGQALSVAEVAAIEAILRAEPAIFPVSGDFQFRGTLLALLMSGELELPDVGRFQAPGRGVRIKGAVIEGGIDLKHGRDHGGGSMPRLALDGCRITGPIQVTSARFEHLCLIRP